ncbi:MAG: SDR family NAD(P)-dependent oxidoreductase [Limimaricola soesokkakensis]|uniref:SDR family NAD(P)-dependent oxidoreductase n=1 Tax=Limimaricola soesokkakensis TaxID=1343159 RepID=UPI004059CEB1
MTGKGLAVFTGGSSGIGYQLARIAIEEGHALVICAHGEELEQAAEQLRRLGGEVEAVRADLSTRQGEEALWSRLQEREIELFFANAGLALGDPFVEQRWEDIAERIDLNVKQTTSMIHRVGRVMRAQGRGRILVTGSIAGQVPGPYNAVYNATKAYVNGLAWALSDEFRETGVTITCLMPGPVDTPIYDKGLKGTLLHDMPKRDAAMVAREGWDAMMAGKVDVVPGPESKLVSLFSGVTPKAITTRLHELGAKRRE